MAEHETTIDLAAAIPETDYADRKHVYEGFLRLLKYSSAVIVVILVLMAIFLT